MPSQYELASQMVQQLRLLDPSVSAEVGTPERKIIDTVAQALNDNQIDLSALATALDIDSKYGASLDRFLALFGFTRQVAAFATGFVTFSRTTPSTSDIRIPANTVVRAFADPDSGLTNNADFYTSFDVILPAGETSISAPIKASVSGTDGNRATNQITGFGSFGVTGVTSVTNETPTTGGRDAEDDDEYKVRFKNTVFRNLAGTQDQYLALAVSLAFTTRANVVGPMSHYREYIQVPNVDDSSSYDINDNGVADAGNGNTNEYTSALSTIPYAKYLWTSTPSFVNNGQTGLATMFYRQDVDFRINTTAAARARGDAYRLYTAYNGSNTPQPNPSDTTIVAPNVTFLNVYTGNNPDVVALGPADVVLFEFSYMSDASRNDLPNGVTNAVDVFVDGGNETFADTVTVRPPTSMAFVDNPASKYHYENYRRAGDPVKRPILGNVLMPLFWQPVLNVPDQIVIGETTYYKNTHYWIIEDVSSLAGTIRARNGLEWSTTVKGQAGEGEQTDPSSYTGPVATSTAGDPVGGQPVEITGYSYDKNIVDLQANLEGAKQITTDVLAHRATRRYFRFDVTVMYTSGASVTDTNNIIYESVDRFLKSQFFGSAIQLSDVLQTIHNVAGVDNVRWTSDIPLPTGQPAPQHLPRVQEVNSSGVPLLGLSFDRVQPGDASTREIQRMYLSGQPTSGTMRMSYINNLGAGGTIDLNYNMTATEVSNAVAQMWGANFTVVEDTRTSTGVRFPIRSFTISSNVGTNGARPVLMAMAGPTPGYAGGPYILNNDFFIRDNELAQLPLEPYIPSTGVGGIADNMPGLVLRPRAQGTWTRGI